MFGSRAFLAILSFGIVPLSACSVIPFHDGSMLCSLDEISSEGSHVKVLNGSSSIAAGDRLIFELKFQTSSGTPCHIQEDQLSIKSSPATPSTIVSGLQGIEVEAENADPQLSWDSQGHVYRVTAALKNAGQRVIQLVLAGEPLSVGTSVSSIDPVEVIPSSTRSEVWFQKISSDFDRVSNNGIEISDAESTEVALATVDEFGNFVSKKTFLPGDIDLSAQNITSSVNGDGNVVLVPRGIGNYSGSISLAGSTASNLPLRVLSSMEKVENLELWVRAESLATNLVDGDLVSAWANQANISGENLVQSSPTLQPRYRSAGLNGHPSVQFDGTDQIARSSLNFGVSSITLVAVYSASGRMGTGGEARLISNGHHGWNTGYFMNATTGRLGAGIGGAGSSASTLVETDDPALAVSFDSQPRIAIMVWNLQDETITLWVNGKKMRILKNPSSGGTLNASANELSTFGLSTLSTNNAHDSRGFRLGAELSTWDLLVGHISEVAVYRKALTTNEIGSVSESLSRKYSVDLYEAP